MTQYLALSAGGLNYAVAYPPSGVPELPREYIDTTYSLPTGGTTRYAYGDEGANGPYNVTLAAALSAAALGDVIVLKAGSTYTGNFVLTDKGAGTDWIYITTSDYAGLPAAGTRVAPADATHMPKVQTSNSSTVFTTLFGAHHYRFVGIEFTSSFSGTGNLIHTGYEGGSNATTDEDFAHHTTIDRCYLHGTDAVAITRAINGGGKHIAVIDCYISEIHVVGQDTQAFYSGRGIGPYKIVNNFLSAAGENLLIGGGSSDGVLVEFNPGDMEITGNYFFKPLTWKPDDPSYAGTLWSVKNIFELKMGERILIEGNLFENCWIGGQRGEAFVFTPRNHSVFDITVRNNCIRGCRVVATLSPANFELSDVRFENNLAYNIVLSGYLTYYASTLRNNTRHSFLHNTTIGMSTHWIQMGDYQYSLVDTVWKDNLSTGGSYEVIGSGKAAGTATIAYFCNGYSFDYNAIIGGHAAYFSGDANITNMFYPANNAAVGFTDNALDSIDDFALLEASTYHNAGSDGTDIGANIPAILAALNDT